MKSILFIISCLILLDGFTNSQPSRHKDSQKLTNQYMKKKNQCHDKICSNSGIFIIIKDIINKHVLSYVYRQSVFKKYLTGQLLNQEQILIHKFKSNSDSVILKILKIIKLIDL